MHFSRFVSTAILVLGLSQIAGAQSAQPAATNGRTATATSAAAAPVDVKRLPVDVSRVGQRLKQTQIREESKGLNLRYYVDVFAPAPKLVLFTPEDNLEYGRAPYGAPTHNEMMEMMTPRPFRNHGGVNILNPKTSSKK
jgi:hypothetical protein